MLRPDGGRVRGWVWSGNPNARTLYGEKAIFSGESVKLLVGAQATSSRRDSAVWQRRVQPGGALCFRAFGRGRSVLWSIWPAGDLCFVRHGHTAICQARSGCVGWLNLAESVVMLAESVVMLT